ncbi:MAG: hypothetical protein EBR82_20655 [Caulobacteraceae bacterium]|nr:hypothetical protein [Caulobacteraceae bacterium]
MTRFASIARNALIGLAFVGASSAAAVAAEPTQATLVAKPLTVVKVAQSRDGYNRRVTIHNQTGWTMLRFYASDARTDSWEEDILGSDTLASGRNWTVNIDDGSGACVYDFRAEFTNGQVLERRGINVCQIADYYYTR